MPGSEPSSQVAPILGGLEVTIIEGLEVPIVKDSFFWRLPSLLVSGSVCAEGVAMGRQP